MLLTNSDDNSARLWDLATGALAIPPLEHGDQVGSAALSPDGTRLVTTSGSAGQLWDARTGRPLGPPLPNPSGARAARWSPDGNSVLVVGRDGIELWDAGLDTGSIDDWHRVARDSSLSQLGATFGATFGAGTSLPTVR